MRISDRIDSQQILGVSLTLIMLLSMGSIGFIGGVGTVGAQTGGTFDQVIDEDESEGLGNDLNLNNSDGVQAVGTDDSAVNAVDLQDDGYVEVDGSINTGDEFAGIAISPERVGSLTGDSYDSSAAFSFLQDNVDTFSVNTDTANIAGGDDLNAEDNNTYPAILIEYAPQSEFSQIDRVEGGHDFLFLVKEGDGVAAYSVNNSDVSASGRTEVVDSTGNTTFEDTIDELADAGLSDGNIDDIQFVAGAGLDDIHDGDTSGTETIREVQLTGNGDFDAAGETIHSEKIALENGGGTTFFSSIDEAEAAAQTGATITVDRGDYDDDDLTGLSTIGLTITTTDRTDADLGPSDRVAGVNTLTDADNEAEIRSQVQVASDTGDVTIEGIVVRDDSADGAIDLTGSGVNNPTVRNVIVEYDNDGGTAIEFDPGNNDGTITDSAVLASDSTVDNTDTGINLNDNNINNPGPLTVTGNLIVGFERQVDGPQGNIDMVEKVLKPNLFGNSSVTPLAQAAVVVDTEVADGGTLQDSGTDIYGSIDTADANAPNGSVIDVFSGTYEEDLEETIDTDNISIIGDTNALLDDNSGSDKIDIANSSVQVTLSNFTVASGDEVEVNGNADAPANAITLTNLTLEEGAGIVEVDPDAADAATITIDGIVHEGLTADDPAVEILDGAGDVVVTDVDVTSDDADASALEIGDDTITRAVESLAVTDVSLEGEPLDSGTNGLTIDITGDTNDIQISNNTVLNGGSGTGIELTEDAGDFALRDNEVRGGTDFTGIALDMSSSNAEIDGNVIIGENVADGIGIDGTFGTTEDSSTLGNALADNKNVITGFERLIDSDMSRSSTADVIEASSDTFGTFINVTDEDTDFSGIDYPGTGISGGDRVAGTLFGSAATAVDNVPTDANLTLTVTNTEVNTTGFEPLEGGPISVDSYDYDSGATATLPSDSPGITVTGEVSTLANAPVNEELAFEVASGNEALGNHDVTDLLIRNDDNAETVISVDGTDGPLNAQSTFENLNVETIGTGVNVSSQNDDVTVIEIRDSIFDVDGDGIVLADSPDDRDGFVIENVTLAGDNLTEDSDTGLNLSNVDTPGKDELPTELEVRGLDVFNFETQLELSEELVTNFPALDAQAVYENDSAVASLDSGDIVFANNNFTQAAFVNESFEADISRLEADIVSEIDDADAVVFADTGEPASQERLADNQTIYGSITEADVTGVDTTSFDGVTLQAVTSAGSPVGPEDDVRVGVFDDAGNFLGNVTISGDQDAVVDVNTSTAIIDVKAASQNLDEPERLYAENVELGAGDTNEATELLVRGPQAGVAATDSARGDEAFILGTVGDTTGDDAAITIDGFTTVAPHEYTVIQFETDISRFDSDLGGFEDGDEFVINQEIENADISDSPVDGDASRFDFDTIAPPTEEAVATFNDNRTISVNNTAFSADVTEDRFIVTEPDDIEIARNNPAPDEIKTSAVGIRVSNVTSATVANSFVGNHTAVDTTGDSVVTSEDHTVDIIDSTLAAGPVDVSTEEADDSPTNTLLFDDIAGFDVNDAANPVGVNAEASLVTVTDSAVDGHTGDGVLLTGDTRASGATVVLDDSAVTNSGARGVAADGTLTDLTVDNTTVADSGSTGVDVNGLNATITEATIQDNNGDGILLSNTLTGAAITQTTIANNTAPGATASGLRLTEFVEAPNVTVRANAFENNDFGIVVEEGDTGTETLDATLNYFGDRNGPAAAGGDSVNENVVYDPFLSEDRTGTSPAAIESTTGFAHDVIVPATDGERTFVAVGFPAQLEGVGLNDTTTVDDYIDPSYDGNVYAFFQSNNSFSPVSGDRKIEAFDALVVENPPSEDRDRVISLEYADDRNPTALPDNRLTYDTGLNFVAPQQAGQVDEVLFPGGDTDAVIQPFPAGENLYGAESADQVRDQFVTVDGAQEVSTNFRSGAGDATVHPHVGYFAVVNENTNNGLTVVESIPVPDSPTADEIANRTDANSDVVVTNAETGETFESLTAALSEVNEFETLVLERGTLAPDRDELTITQDNIRLVGQGEAQTEIAADLVINGSSIQIDAVDVVTNSPTGKITVTGPGASLNAVNAEDGIEIQAERTSVTGGSVGNLTIDDGVTSATVTDTDVTNTLEINSTSSEVSVSNTTADTVSAQPGSTLTDVSQRTVEVANASDLRDAATNDLDRAPVGSQTTIEVTSDIDDTSNADPIDVTVDGVTITSATGEETVTGDRSGGTPTFAIEADGVTVTDVGVTHNTNSPDRPSQGLRIAASDVTVDNVDVEADGDQAVGVGVLTRENPGGDVGDPVTVDNVEIVDSAFTLNTNTIGVLVGQQSAGSFGADPVTIDGNTFSTAQSATGTTFVVDVNNSADTTKPGDVLDLDAVAADNTFSDAEPLVTEIELDTRGAFDAIIADAREDEALNANSGVRSGSVQNAVDAAEDGDTIRVGPGLFDESVTIDVEGLTLEAADGATSTIIGQSSIAVTSTAPNVEIADLRIENPDGSRAVRVTDDATGVVIQDNTVTNVNRNNDATQPRGIVVGGLDGGDSADGLEIRNNTVTNVEGAAADADQAHAIQILEESNRGELNGDGLIEDVVVDGNTIEDISDTRSTVAVNFNGNIEGEITNNDISGLNTDRPGEGNRGFTQAIALNEGGNAGSAPQNVEISGNEISNLETAETKQTDPSFPAAHIILEPVDDVDSINITDNDFTAASDGERYIIDRAAGEFDLQEAIDENTFDPNAVEISEGDDALAAETDDSE